MIGTIPEPPTRNPRPGTPGTNGHLPLHDFKDPWKVEKKMTPKPVSSESKYIGLTMKQVG